MAAYVDYGPRPTPETPARRLGRWAGRPYCDMCGPFRGRYLRTMPNGETRCRGCDRENEADCPGRD
jgi:hypothetical protein